MKKLLLLLLIVFSNSIFAQCWKQVEAGYQSAIGLTDEGKIYTWGFSTGTILQSSGAYNNNNEPTQVGTSSDWKFISAGLYNYFAIKLDGTLWAWGLYDGYDFGNGITITTSTPIQIGTDTDWKAVSAGDRYRIAIKENGTLWGWGRNQQGQLGLGITNHTNQNVPIQIGADTDWKEISAGQNGSTAIKNNGSLWLWVPTVANSFDVPTQFSSSLNWSKTKSCLFGENFIHLKTDGTLWVWGSNSNGQLMNLSSLVSYVATLTQVGTDTDWVSIFVGQRNYSAIKNNTTLWSWGSNLNKEITADSSVTTILTPTLVHAEINQNWLYRSGGASNFYAIDTNKKLWSWGNSQNGTGGDGNPSNHFLVSPIVIGSPCVLSTSSFNESSSLEVYPNPFKSNFTLNIQSPINDRVSVKVYDMLGKLVDDLNVDYLNSNNLQIGDKYNTGIYNVIVSQREYTKSLRIIKN